MTSTSAKYKGWSHSPDETREPEAEYPEFTGDNRDQRGYLYWCALWLGECRRILRTGGVVMMFTDWRQLPTTTDAIQAGGLVWRGIVVWDKGIGRPVKGRFRNHVEYVCWGTHGPMSDVNDVYPSSVIRSTPPTHTNRVHRTEKPVELLDELLTITRPGGTVLDPFMGSGTTGVACVNTGKNFIGCEIDEGYFKIAERRIAAAQAARAELLIA
jgi:site-specific DNA-methyltransferase (adenine-specific)